MVSGSGENIIMDVCCPSCEHVWNYKGKILIMPKEKISKYFITCSVCYKKCRLGDAESALNVYLKNKHKRIHNV